MSSTAIFPPHKLRACVSVHLGIAARDDRCHPDGIEGNVIPASLSFCRCAVCLLKYCDIVSLRCLTKD
jgi:hypothetical protein